MERFPVFAPVALAGIGRLPDTVQDRSIVIRLKRRSINDTVEKFRRREIDAHASELRAAISRWAQTNMTTLAADCPTVPEMLGDRAADIWEPLLAIANLAGGHWPERAASAATALSASHDDDDGSDGVRLLADIRRIFDFLHRQQLSSAGLVRALTAIEDAPWAEHKMDARALARTLRPFDVRPRSLRTGENVVRGYVLADFADSFDRYLPPAPSQSVRRCSGVADVAAIRRHHPAQAACPGPLRSGALAPERAATLAARPTTVTTRSTPTASDPERTSHNRANFGFSVWLRRRQCPE